MIAVDTSALIAILLDEPEAGVCVEAIRRERQLSISAVTVAETLIVAGRRDLMAEAGELLDGLGFEIDTVTGATARRVAEAYGRWGKGAHPAGLNFGDCFAYATAKAHGCPLLYVGDDFSRTDVEDARRRPT